MVVFQNEHCWVECCFLMLRRIKGCSLPSININKSKIIQTRRIFILDDSASSDLAVTCDCGHSLRFTPTRWRRGQTATWQGLHKGHHSTCCHGDGWWRAQEVNNNIVRSLCYFPWFFFYKDWSKKGGKREMTKEFSKNESSPKCHFVNPSWFLSLFDLMTSSRHLTLTSRPRLRGVKPVWVCVWMYEKMNESSGHVNGSNHNDIPLMMRYIKTMLIMVPM